MEATSTPRESVPRDGSPQGDRSERMLGILGKLIQHDFSNQLVVLQGLLELLEIDEKENMSAQGQELLQRIKKAAQRALGTGHQIRDAFGLLALGEPAENTDAAQFLEDFRMQVKKTFAERAFEWQTSGMPVAFRAGRKTLLRIFEDLLRVTLTFVPGKKYQIGVKFGSEGRHVKVCMRVQRHDGATALLPPLAQWENCKEILLGREFLTGWGGGLDVNLETESTVAFIFSLPG